MCKTDTQIHHKGESSNHYKHCLGKLGDVIGIISKHCKQGSNFFCSLSSSHKWKWNARLTGVKINARLLLVPLMYTEKKELSPFLYIIKTTTVPELKRPFGTNHISVGTKQKGLL